MLAVTTLDWSRDHLTSAPRLYGAAAELVYESNGTFGVEETVERTVATPGVEAVSRQLMINDDTMPATGTRRAEVEPEAFETILGGARPPVSDGRHPEGPGEVALGRATAEDLGVGIGDEVSIAAFDGSATSTLRVTGTVVTWGDDDTTHGFIVTVPTLRSLICPGAAPDDCNLSADVFADVTDDAAGEAARATLLDHGFGRVLPPGSVDRLGEIGAIPAYLAGFLCVLAAAAMLHQLTITLRRRRQDLAVARALGLPARCAASALTWQAMLDRHRRSHPRSDGRGDRRTAGVANHGRERRRPDGDPVPRCRHPDRRPRRRGRRRARVPRPTNAGSTPAARRDVEGRVKLETRRRASGQRARGRRGQELRAWPENAMMAAALWAWSDIRRRHWSLLALAAVVALPVGFSLALVAGAQRAGASVDRFVESTGLADVVVFTGGEPGPDVLERIAADRRVTALERTNTVVIVPSPMELGESGFALVGTDELPVGGLRSPMLLAGRYPSAGAATEIMVNERAAQKYGFEVGMRAPLTGLVSFDSWEARPVGEATIVGIVRTPFDLVDDPSTESFAIAGPRFIEGDWGELARPGTILWLHLDDRGDIGAVVSDLSTIVDGDVRGTADMLSTAERAASLQRRGLLLAGGVVAAAGVVVAQAVARHLAVRSEDSDVLASIGLTRGERWKAATLSVAPALAAGAVIGTALAIGLSPLLPLGLPAEPIPASGSTPTGSSSPRSRRCRRAHRRGDGAGHLAMATRRKHRVDDRPALAGRLGSALGLRPVPLTGTRLALEGGRGRRRMPAIPTLVALVATTGVVVGSLIVSAGLDGLVANADRYGQPWDVFVTSVHEAELADAGRLLSEDARVAGVDLARSGELNITTPAGTTTQIGAIGLDGATGPMWLAVLDGRAPGGPAEIAVASRTMDQLGLEVGDSTTVSGACGERSVTVVGRAIVPLILTGDPDHGAVVTGDLFAELCGAELIAEIDREYGALIRLHDPADTDAVLDELFPEAAFTQLPGIPSSVTTLAEIGQVPLIVAVLVALIGIAAAANSLVLVGRRRGADLAILRGPWHAPRRRAPSVQLAGSDDGRRSPRRSVFRPA